MTPLPHTTGPTYSTDLFWQSNEGILMARVLLEVPFQLQVPAHFVIERSVTVGEDGYPSQSGTTDVNCLAEVRHFEYDVDQRVGPAISWAMDTGAREDYGFVQLVEPFTTSRSVVVSYIPITPEIDTNRRSLLPIACELANEIATSWHLFSPDATVRPVARGDAPPFTPIAIGRPYDGYFEEEEWAVVHNGVAAPLQQTAVALNAAALQATQSVLASRRDIKAAQWFRRAAAHRLRGHTEEAVVCAQTAAEVFCTELLVALLTERGCDATEESAARERQQSSTLNELARLLHGSGWERAGRDTALGRYWADCKKLRDRIAHAGHGPSQADADAALAGGERAHRVPR